MEPTDLIVVLAIVLWAVGILIARLPVEECPFCRHCQARREADERARQWAHDQEHPQDVGGCLRCQERRQRRG